MDTPVVFIVYKRPQHTLKVFEQISSARPSKLYLIADGPKDSDNDEKKCREVREIIKNINWPCQVERLFADKNMGSKYRVSSGLDYVFSKEKEAIILEDDCLPDQSFFKYCQELLEKFNNDESIFMISGHNPLGRYSRTNSSYFYGVQGTWGWATWRRAWKHFEVEIPKFKDETYLKKMREFFRQNENLINDLERGCHLMLENGIDAWDYQWQFACAINNGLTVYPSVNLVKNIGFGKDATHTFNPQNILAKTKLYTMQFPMTHNEDIEFDVDFINMFYGYLRASKNRSLLSKILRKIISVKNA